MVNCGGSDDYLGGSLGGTDVKRRFGSLCFGVYNLYESVHIRLKAVKRFADCGDVSGTSPEVPRPRMKNKSSVWRYEPLLASEVDEDSALVALVIHGYRVARGLRAGLLAALAGVDFRGVAARGGWRYF